jgi:transmembrane sensor
VLVPGQQAVLASAMPVSVDHVDLRKVEAWRYGQIILDGTALGDIVADLNRYGGPQIVLADPKLADIRVSGVFHTGRPDVFVEAVTTAFPVRVSEQTPDRIVLAPR